MQNRTSLLLSTTQVAKMQQYHRICYPDREYQFLEQFFRTHNELSIEATQALLSLGLAHEQPFSRTPTEYLHTPVNDDLNQIL